MTREEFIKILDKKEYSYKIQGNKVIVTHKGNVDLRDLTSLPPGVEFRNKGSLWLDSLTSLPPGVVFGNGGFIMLITVTSLPSGVVFKNKGNIWLGSLTGWFYHWEGNIEGINKNRLLNKMISIGIFER
jgi:hypothetical protein